MIAIGSDHGGYKLKEELKKYLKELGIEYKDCGTDTEERTDYPIYAKKVSESIQNGEAEEGLLICRSGCGMTMVANKFKGIRAGNVTTIEYAKAAKADDNINLLVLSGDYMKTEEAVEIFKAWKNTEFKTKDPRYKARLDMLEEIEKQNMK